MMVQLFSFAPRFWSVLLAVAIGSGLAGSALAQSSNVNELINRVDRLQRELTTLQQQVYRGGAPPAVTGSPAVSIGAGGETAAARMELRVTEIEGELRTLTGRTEEITFAIEGIKRRLEKLVADVDTRLPALERSRAQPASEEPAANSAAPPPGQQVAAQPGARPAPTQPPPAAGGQQGQILGTIPPSALETQSGAAMAAATRPVLPEGSPKDQYDFAISLIFKDQDYPQAERALKEFIGKNGTHALAGNANYWLGETFYGRKDYQQSAFAFAEAFQKYPKSAKAPDSLYKLGLSLAQLNKTKEACTAFGRLTENFPNADATLKSRVRHEQRRLACR